MNESSSESASAGFSGSERSAGARNGDRWPVNRSAMSGRIRDYDWAATPLGPIGEWPQSLRTMVDLILAMRQPASIAWGAELTLLYNDAFAALVEPCRANALARPLGDLWHGIWDGYEAALAAVMTGEALHFVDQPLALAVGPDRPASWFTFSWTPVRGESGEVAGVHCAMSDRTEAVLASEARRDSEERYRSLISHSTEGIWLLELDPPLDTSLSEDEQIAFAYRHGRFVGCNDAMARMYGLARADDLIGKTLEFPMPVTDEETKAYLTMIIRSGYNLTDVESVEYDIAGNRKYFANNMIGIVENGLLKRLWGIQREITDRVRAEEQRTLLINELNHRVKNTLATVQSIASQTLRNAENMADAKAAFENRLIALARAHDVLTRENWEGADLHEIALQAVAPYANWPEDRLHLDGPSVRLQPRMALALSMVLQELATNAVKYGALSNDVGRIRIEWDVEQTEPERLLLRWEESDGPAVRPPSRRGFGSSLIERGLAQDLNGSARIAFPCTGVICTLDAPLG